MLLLVLRLGLHSSSCSNRPQQQQRMPATTPAAAAVAAIKHVELLLLLLLSLSCTEETLSSAQAPLEVGTALDRGVISALVLGTRNWA